MKSWRTTRWCVILAAAIAAVPGVATSAPPAPATRPLAAAPATRPQTSAAILDEARRIVAAIKETRYSHTTDIDDANGKYVCDCSSLLRFILRRVSRKHLDAIPPQANENRARAYAFYEAFAALPAEGSRTWKRIDRVADLQPGDVIAWRHAEIEPGKSTGHVMIVETAPAHVQGNVWSVTVIDSTSTPHVQDSRPKDTTGVGRGRIYLEADEAGNIKGHANEPQPKRFNRPKINASRAI